MGKVREPLLCTPHLMLHKPCVGINLFKDIHVILKKCEVTLLNPAVLNSTVCGRKRKPRMGEISNYQMVLSKFTHLTILSQFLLYSEIF